MLASIIRERREPFMKKHETVPKKNDTTRQAMEFNAAVLKQLPHLSPVEMQYWIKNQGELQRKLANVLINPDPRKEWKRFYREVFGIPGNIIKEYFADMVLPEKQEGFDWLIIVIEGLTIDKLLDKCRERLVSFWYADDLNNIKSVRIATKTYAVWVRDRIEADKENKNKSAKDCEKEGITGITFEERVLLELFYHWRTGNKHLDLENATICSGSLDSGGFVPLVGFRNGKVHFNYHGCSPDAASESMRTRAVSL